MKVRAVLFDLDGTLIDTEKYYRVCWPAAMKEFGFDMSDEQALSMRSLGRPFAPVHLKEMFGETVDYYAVRAKRREIMDALLKEKGIEVKHGAVELLKYLREKGIMTGVATATDLERTKRYLEETGLLRYFDRLISAVMVEKGKPAPDIYLYACDMMGLKPGECAAVEDAPNGIRSAFAAGCSVIMVPDQTGPDDELKTMISARCDSLADIMNVIEGQP